MKVAALVVLSVLIALGTLFGLRAMSVASFHSECRDTAYARYPGQLLADSVTFGDTTWAMLSTEWFFRLETEADHATFDAAADPNVAYPEDVPNHYFTPPDYSFGAKQNFLAALTRIEGRIAAGEKVIQTLGTATLTTQLNDQISTSFLCEVQAKETLVGPKFDPINVRIDGYNITGWALQD